MTFFVEFVWDNVMIVRFSDVLVEFVWNNVMILKYHNIFGRFCIEYPPAPYLGCTGIELVLV